MSNENNARETQILTLLRYIPDQKHQWWSGHQPHLLDFAADIELSKGSWSSQKEGHTEAPMHKASHKQVSKPNEFNIKKRSN